MSTSYTPLIRQLQPAFVGTAYIYFTMPYNATPSTIFYRIIDPSISSADGNNIIAFGSATPSLVTGTDEYYISADLSDLTTDKYYQIQIQQSESNWSAAALIKKVDDFTLPSSITGIPPFDDATASGKAVSEDPIFLKSCSFTVGTNTVEGICTGNSFQIPVKSFFSNGTNTVAGTLSLETVDGYVKTEPDLSLTLQGISSTGTSLQAILLPYLGVVKLTSSAIGTIIRKEVGQLLWTKVGNKISSADWIDASIEGGKWYQYKIISRVPSNNNTSVAAVKNLDGEECETAFSNLYLSNQDILIAFQFKPSMSGVKYVVQESITNTLGGRFPVIRKNGSTKYKQFNISGTLYLDYYTVETFLDSDSQFKWSTTNDVWLCDDGGLFLSQEKNTELGSLKGYSHYAREKILRKIAEDFLTDGKPKVFRSYEEGPMIVHLSNISFTPNKQLDSHIYDFSAQVTEMCEFSSSNLEKYNLGTTSLSQFFVDDTEEA